MPTNLSTKKDLRKPTNKEKSLKSNYKKTLKNSESPNKLFSQQLNSLQGQLSDAEDNAIFLNRWR